MQELVRFLFEKTGHQVAEGALSQNADATEVRLQLSTADIQKLSSSEARLVRAFRAILSASAAAKNTRVTLEIDEAA